MLQTFTLAPREGWGGVIGHLEMTNDALGETQMLDRADGRMIIF